MTDTAGPFDGTPWAEAQWARHAAAWAPSGVYGAPAASTTTGDLPLSVSGRSVGLGAGRAWVRGFGFERTGAAVMQDPGANTHASFSRRDRIVLRRNLATHTISQFVIQGTPASSPAAPTLTQSESGSWDLPMFSFLVPPNSGTGITGFVDERAFINPDSNSLAVYGADGLAALAARPSIIANQRAYTSSDKGFWRYDGTRWVKDGGGPEFLTGSAVGTGATAQPNAGDTLVGTSFIPAHRPGTLRFQIRYTWTAPGPALVTAKLQYPAGTDVPGSGTQLHNRGSTAPQSMISEGYMPSDGTARTLGLYVSSGMGGNPVSLDTMNAAVWLI